MDARVPPPATGLPPPSPVTEACVSPPDRTNFADLLRDRARAHPDRVAVRFPVSARTREWTSVTFAEVDAAADAYARGFAAAGLRPGDRTLLMVRPSIDFYGMVFGLFRAGAVPVFIDPGMGLSKALACVAQIAPRSMIAPSVVHAVRTLYRAPFVTTEVPITMGARWWWGGPTLEACRAGDGPARDHRANPDDDAVIVFTSGSTGPAKGVSLTHRCMRARVQLIQEMLDLRAGETISETLLVYTILEVCMGLTVVIPPMDLAKPAAVDPAHVIATIERFTPSVASASPVVWQKLVRHCIDANLRLPSLRMLLTSAAPIPVDLHARLSKVVPETTQLFTPYGATEAMPVALIGTALVLAETGERTGQGEGTCVGALAPGIEVRLITVHDDPIPAWRDDLLVPAGEIGEITARGDGVSRAYRNAPEGNNLSKIGEGATVWHRMGDLGRFDAQGRLWFLGRKSHRLQTAAGLVPCVAVEGVYNQHPDVYRTALVGVGEPGHQVPVLCVELEPGRTFTPELQAQLQDLARPTPWRDTVVRFLPHPGFPTDARHNSKIRNEDLRDWATRQCPDLLRA
jgi:acyl-CoA synthetase (AMP-forming)/AMP-acid ligase II